MAGKGFKRSRSALSTVMASLILAVITIAIVIPALSWTGSLATLFTRYEKIEIKSTYAESAGGNYVVYLEYVNTGSSSTSIDSILLNDVPYSSYTPTPILGGSFTSLPSTMDLGSGPGASSSCEVGVQQTGTLNLKEGTKDPNGNELSAGVALMVTLHTSSGNDYPASIVLPSGGQINQTIQDNQPYNDSNVTDSSFAQLNASDKTDTGALDGSLNYSQPEVQTLTKLHVNGTLIVNEAGSPVRLAGYNVHSYHKWAALRVSDDDLLWIKDNGFNAVRIVVYWSDFELKPGIYDESFFFNYLDPLINSCERNGIYAIIDMHQWRWSPRWGGYGIPVCYTDMYDNTSEGMTQCALDFWLDRGQGEKTQNAFIEAWKYVANRYKGRSVIAAYDLFNEPYSWDGSEAYLELFWPKVMSFFNERLVPAIRSVDPDTIIIYDAVYKADLNTMQQNSNIVWGRSWYDYSAERIGVYDSNVYEAKVRSRLAEYIQRFTGDFKAPFVILEIGGDQSLGNNLQWINDSLTIYSNLTNGLGSFFYWRYGKTDSNWEPRNLAGQDLLLADVLRKIVLRH